jgi:hypothetical protein
MNEKDWVTCKWPLKELNRQRVEFTTDPKHTVKAGIGEFIAAQRPDKKMKIEISVDTAGPGNNERTDRRWTLDQAQANAIEEHPAPSTARFRMFAARGSSAK